MLGDGYVHSRCVLSWKEDAAIHYDYVVPPLQHHHVFADFPKAAQGNQLQRWVVATYLPWENMSSCWAGGFGSSTVGAALSTRLGIALKSFSMTLRRFPLWRAAAGWYMG